MRDGASGARASQLLQAFVSWPSWSVLKFYKFSKFLSSQYTLASPRRSQRCARIVGARRVSTETTRLTTPREILVLWLRHEALGLVRAVKPATKQRVAAVQNVPFEARKECARRKTLRHSDGCAEGWPSRPNKVFLLPERIRRWSEGSGKWRRKRLHAQSVSPRHPRRAKNTRNCRRAADVTTPAA